jgi:choline kinase
MEAAILAAGQGSRLKRECDDLPKIFIRISGKPLYMWQISKLDPHCDCITFMLGHGFEGDLNPEREFDIPDEVTADIQFTVLDDWEGHENGYTAKEALKDIDDDTVLVCGDVIFSQKVIDRIVSRFNQSHKESGGNTVGAIESVQDEMTAIRLDDKGRVSEYGAISGHQEVGLFVLNQHNLREAINILENNLDYWFPIIFQEIPSWPVFVAESERHEINTRKHLQRARVKFPLNKTKQENWL